MKLLAFSDLHRDMARAADLVSRSAQADVVIGAGDFASVHDGLEETIDALASIEKPTILVPGNNETEKALLAATEQWEAATVLHGNGTSVDGVRFWGLGAGVPVTPWDWSFDLEERDATDRFRACPPDAVIVLHSPPKGHCDRSSQGDHLGSEAIYEAIAERTSPLAVCGHIHEAWGCESQIGETRVLNLGPAGTEIEL